MSPPRWDTRKSLSKVSFRISCHFAGTTMFISLLLLKQWITFAGRDLMILKKDAGQVKTLNFELLQDGVGAKERTVDRVNQVINF